MMYPPELERLKGLPCADEHTLCTRWVWTPTRRLIRNHLVFAVRQAFDCAQRSIKPRIFNDVQIRQHDHVNFWYGSGGRKHSRHSVISVAVAYRLVGLRCPMATISRISCLAYIKPYTSTLSTHRRKLTGEQLPFNDPNVVILVTNSNVKDELSGSEYSKRRADFFAVAQALGKRSLRDVDLKLLLENETSLDATVFRRARHAVTEIDRVAKAVDTLEKHDYAVFGQLMNESQFSLRDDYEVSCPELDRLVNIAQKCNGVFGSRLTGYGFGGCTVTLVKKEFVDELISELRPFWQSFVLDPPTPAPIYGATPGSLYDADVEAWNTIDLERSWIC